MGYDRKYGRVTCERGSIGVDEPVFVIRAKDAAAPTALYAYAEVAADAGADDGLVESVRERAEQMAAWQREHAEIVRVPDTLPGQLREPGALGFSEDELKGAAR